MSTKRPPAPAPQLPGFTFVDVLGSGGFADVYLFEQHLPRRKVAVKVLLPEKLAGGSMEQFAAEANVMAMLSTHPAIVTIYQAGVSDDQRPYLAMEYCPKPNLQVRSRTAPLSVAESLRIGIQVAAAAETAHRASILHRDIKPANILVTEYNRPALTDFGIATSTGDVSEASGMSIPWSPPESFADRAEFDVRSDVWALGATVYTLLTGRSPFEIPGGKNGGAALIQRIESESLPPLGRADAPPSLQQTLERAMAKNPADRFDSAVAFARALQRVQIELAHGVTPVDILDDSPDADEAEDEDGELTRVRGIVSIDPQTVPASGPTRDRMIAFAPPSSPAALDDATVARADAPISPSLDDPTVVRGPVSIPATPPAPYGAQNAAAGASPTVPPSAAAPSAPAAAPTGPGQPRSRAGLWIGISVAAALVVVALIVTALTFLVPRPEPVASTTVAPQNPIAGVVPPPVDLRDQVDGGSVEFTWTNPDPQEGDTYRWYTYTLQESGESRSTDATSVTVDADPSGTTCMRVLTVRANGASSTEAQHCTGD